MTQIKDIRKMYFEEGKNISQIARETGHDRKTVRAYLDKVAWNKKPPKVKKENAFPKLDPYKHDIDAWLNEDKKARRKQRLTAKRLYNRLVEKYGERFYCSFRTVGGYVAVKKKEIFSAIVGFLPLVHTACEAQADFGEADIYENGTHYRGKSQT